MAKSPIPRRTDTVSTEVRSATMRAVKSRGVRSTERKLRAALISRGLRGWRMYADDLPGKPDFVFVERKVAVFVDGCFWHGCKRCYRRPHSNQRYWDAKVVQNMSRDRRNRARLRRAGWQVMRIWEHEVAADLARVCARLKTQLHSGGAPITSR
jgi:DNA mismatch endonuclease, patch repair protein